MNKGNYNSCKHLFECKFYQSQDLCYNKELCNHGIINWRFKTIIECNTCGIQSNMYQSDNSTLILFNCKCNSNFKIS